MSASDIINTHHMKIAILGFGREGQSLLKFLQGRGVPQKKFGIDAKNSELWVLDENRNIQTPKGVHRQVGPRYLKDLERFDVIFRSPGIPYLLPQLQRARRADVTISSPTKLFFELCPTKNIVGVTGTKGKGTTSTLIYRILKAAGKKAFLAGNIGKPALDLLPKLDRRSWVVLELSSFQLIDLDRSPHIGVALMVTSEHLDWHKTTREYVAAKANIVRFQSAKDFAVLAEDYSRSMSYARKTRAAVFTFSKRSEVRKGTGVKNGSFLFSGGKKKEKVCDVHELRIPGTHNFENAGAAITVAKIVGIGNTTIAKAIRSFKGLKHRLEFVAKVRGVRYYNDSYATTPETAEVAIAAFDTPKILILGGASKGSDFKKLGYTISRSKSIRAIIGIGAEWPRIKTHIRNPKLQVIEGCKNMHEIVRAANKVAAPGDVVLLSPACASFGMFENYTERGKQFKEAVQGLQNKRSGRS
jgi:UDP-N-acetylmuramoylalanine--D-glutamate ligase